MGNLVEDFVAQGLALRQTHISNVFLGDERVYKVKRPVNLGFLDFSTLEQRHHFCEAEVTLNRRLAPDVYLGVVPITRDARGVHQLGGGGQTVEYAVEMRHMPDANSCEQRLREGRLGTDEIARIAARLAEFHAAVRCDTETARFGSSELIEANVRENFAQTRDTAPHALSSRELASIARWQLDFVNARRALFARRIARGRIRDGHGDLRLEHCYLDDAGQVEILDCIEFNERFRYADVCADLAFLAMDLNHAGHRDLSEALLAHYARITGDYELYAVVDFYQSYRAYVRGKVHSFVESQAQSEPERARATAEARKFYLLAEACTRPSLERGQLIVVAGTIASGKSTVAEHLGRCLQAPVLASDWLRKQRAGVDAYTKLPAAAFDGHYSRTQTDAVYSTLLEAATCVLASGRSVVLDASFRECKQRQAARALAAHHGLPFTLVECRVNPDNARARLAQRSQQASVSDGRLEVFDAFSASFEPVSELSAHEHIVLDTNHTQPNEQPQLARLAQRTRATSR